jgi:uncharacterized protein (DUF362 family)/Pyruvate/2-oxoacid:ferredoxin oxidoreductase delta subunit
MYDVSIVRCEEYKASLAREALTEAIDAVGGLDWVEKGMKIVIKANLVSFMSPESAATTHPTLLCELVKMLVARGAEVIVGDSPGGLYTSVYVNRVYKATGMKEVEQAGAHLNQNFEQREVDNPNGMVLKRFAYTSYLDEADAIIDFCKLKTHGMMGMSAAAKNMFGCIPGVTKPEYHFRFPKHEDFARMIVDLDDYFKPRLCICDAVVGMEGNGPTMGEPRKIGAVLASTCPHKMDLVCAHIIGLTKDTVPTLAAAYERELIPTEVKSLSIFGDPDSFFVPDFKNIPNHSSMEFSKDSTKFFGKLSALFIAKALRSVPALKSRECVGCGVCRDICPAKAIQIKNGKAVIDRSACIRCFCCQEFCPKGAMKVKRPWIAKVLNR